MPWHRSDPPPPCFLKGRGKVNSNYLPLTMIEIGIGVGWGQGKLGQGLGALKRGGVGTPLQTKYDKVLGKAPG